MAVGDTRRLRVVIDGESSGAETAFERTGDAAKKSESKLAKMAKFLGAMAIRGGAALGAIGVAAATMGIKTATQLEQVTVGFTTMLGSAEKARKFLGELQKFAAATPFEFDQLTGAAQRFLAMGFAAKDVIPMLTAVGDAVAAMGGGAESIDAVTRALSQMQAKGKVSGEELMQLTEQGIPALQILADKYGVSTSQMSKMIEKGKVMSDKAIPAIIDALEHGTKNVQGFGGMMAKQSETMAGKWSTFMDNLKTGMANLFVSTLPTLKKLLDFASTAIADFFAGLQGKGKLAGFTSTINQIGLGLRAMVAAFKEGDVTSDGLVGKFEALGVAVRYVVDTLTELVSWVINVVHWFRENDTVAKALSITIGSLIVLTKAHAVAIAIQGGAITKFWKSTMLYNTAMKVSAALQWAWNGAVAAGNFAQMAVLLDGYLIKQKLVALWTKLLAAAQWLWNVAMTANPIGIVIVAVAAFVAAIILLWKNSDGFRKFVTDKLWPAIKVVWEAIKTAALAVANAFVAAWNWIKDTAISVWSAITAFIGRVVTNIVNFFQPLINVIATIGNIVWIFYSNIWKAVWILVQIAIKVAVFYFKNTVLPLWTAGFALLRAGLSVLAKGFSIIWGGIQKAVQFVADWWNTSVVTRWQNGINRLKAALAFLQAWFSAKWDAISAKVQAAVSKITGPIMGGINRGINNVRSWVTLFHAWWNDRWTKIQNKIDSFKTGVVNAFNKLKDGVTAAWQKLADLAKRPVNFLIGNIYSDRVVPMWNRLAEKFGIKTRLSPIPRLRTGGTVPGTGFTDKVPALLTPGEGVLNLKEMKALGGPQGFAALREQISAFAQFGRGGMVQKFGDGGVVGWFKNLAGKGKDIVQGLAADAINPLVNIIRGVVNSGLKGGGLTGLLRGGANTILSNFMNWVRGKDKEIPAIGGGGSAIGWRAMVALIQRVFPSLHMISGFRPGARTLSGNQSYHALGRAVDYPPIRILAAWIRANFGRATKELITPWQNLNLLNGRPHTYTGAVWNQHNFAGGNAHVHWAMDGVTNLEPGLNIGWNRTGKTETVVNKDMIPGGVHFHGPVYFQGVSDIKAFRDELKKLASRNGNRAGLPSK